MTYTLPSLGGVGIHWYDIWIVTCSASLRIGVGKTFRWAGTVEMISHAEFTATLIDTFPEIEAEMRDVEQRCGRRYRLRQ